jgi:hypothetical protein
MNRVEAAVEHVQQQVTMRENSAIRDGVVIKAARCPDDTVPTIIDRYIAKYAIRAIAITHERVSRRV